MRTEISIFYRGSRTFFVSSLFFPRNQRADVFKLYSFLRLVDDYVDQPTPDKEKFNKIRALWGEAVKSSDFDKTSHRSDSVELKVIKNMLNLTRKYDFDPAWIEAFFDSMEADIKGRKYRTLEQTLEYVYGSAEVVGLMMARIMDLPPQADKSARMQGRAFQWINFIRDVAEDNRIGRQYFPGEELRRFNLKNLSEKTAENQPEDFERFIQFQIDRYVEWQEAAKNGYRFITFRSRMPILAASRSYGWTANQILENPLVVFGRKVKPASYRIVWNLIKI